LAEKRLRKATVAVGRQTRQLNGLSQGCQMVYFQTKKPNLFKFWRVVQWKRLIYYMASWSIFRPFYGTLVYFVAIGIFYGTLVYFVAIWYILWHFGIFCGRLVNFPRFACLNHEKSGNPGLSLICVPTYTVVITAIVIAPKRPVMYGTEAYS
jgi:hypothetical protein